MKNEKTKKALTGLEWAIAQTIKEPKQADEFTIDEFSQASNLTISQAQGQLKRMIDRKLLTKRKILISGKQSNLFRKAD